MTKLYRYAKLFCCLVTSVLLVLVLTTQTELNLQLPDLQKYESIFDYETPALKLKAYHQKKRYQGLKYILHWNDFFGDYTYGLEADGRGPFLENDCPESRCYVTSNRSLLPVEDYAAVVFHGRSLEEADLPLSRSTRQRYIYFTLESPINTKENISSFVDFFNWTASYRTDSDIYKPYGKILQIKEFDKDDKLDAYITEYGKKNTELAGGKRGVAAWFVSNCETASKREDFVQELSEHFPVDIYGKCGNLTCPRDTEAECNNMLEADYMFYLSFENSICRNGLPFAPSQFVPRIISQKVVRHYYVYHFYPQIKGLLNNNSSAYTF